MTSEDDERGPGSADAPPIEDLFDFREDEIDFMSAESFPASDPLPPPSSITPSWDEE